MKEDLMQTQTGGQGETIQLQNTNTPTAQEFDVKIKPTAEQPTEPVKTQPTEPVKTQPTAPVQQEVGMPQGPVVEEQVTTQVSPEAAPEAVPQVETTEDIFNDDSLVQPRPLSIPNQEEKVEIKEPITEVKTDLVQPIQFVDDDFDPVKKEVSFENIELPVAYKEDPSNPDVLVPATNTTPQLNQEYKDKPVKVNPNGHVVKAQPKKTEQVPSKADGFYIYGDDIYKKSGNNWYKDVGEGNFKQLQSGDVAARQAELNKNASQINYNTKTQLYKYNDHFYEKRGSEWYKEVNGSFVKLTGEKIPERKAILDANAKRYYPSGDQTQLNKSGEILGGKYGRIGDFNSYNALTSGGDRAMTAGLSFSTLTANPIAPKDRMYNDDGTYNFTYDANYAKSSPQTRAIIDKSQEKPKVAAMPTVKLTTGLDLNGVKNTVNQLNDPQYQQAFENAVNFSNKDLQTMFAKEAKLSDNQLTALDQFQDQAKKIIGDGKYTADKAKALTQVMSDAENFFNQAKEVNQFVNEAYARDMSLARYSLEKKKEEYMDQLNLRDNGDFQDAARQSFESTVKIADFIQDNIDAGKIMYDRATGGYKFSTNISDTERKYIENQLSTMNAGYEKLQQENYASVRSEIGEYKGELSTINAQINSLKKQAQGLSQNDPRLKEINGQLFSLNKERSLLEKKIDNNESLLSTVFKTEPLKLAKSASRNLTSTSENILSAIPSDFSPKERFDFFYRQLSTANQNLAKNNGIDEQYLSRLSRRFKDMFDWGGYMSLTQQEKEYLHNKALLNQLAPMYYNNDFGITQSSGGFFESFMNGFAKTLTPATAASDGYFAQSEAANTAKAFLNEKGFSDDDFVDDEAMAALEEATKVDFASWETAGSMVGTTAAIIAPLVITDQIPATAFRIGNSVEKLVTGTKNVQKISQYINRAENAFDAALSTTKFGKYILTPAVKEGLKFEAVGEVFGSTEDEMYFMSGLVGGAASEAFSIALSKMAPTAAYKYIESIFGGSTSKAVSALKRGGQASVRGVVETVEEASQELTNIYTDELRQNGFFEEVQTRFGTLDDVQKFLVSSFIMGAAFGLAKSDTSNDAYDSLNDAKKKQLNDVLTAVKADFNFAEEKTEEYVDAQEKQIKREERVDSEPEINPEFAESGEIDFDVDNIEKADEGKPSVVEKAEENPSSFTEPIDLFNIEGNDQENQQGLPSEERVGQEPVEEQPVTKPSEETPSPSGVVQGEQKVAIGETVEVNGKKYTKVETSLVGEPKGTAYQGEDGVSYNTEWVEKNMTPKAAPATEPVGKTEELPTTEANPFEELADTIKLKGTAKTNAIKALKQKYGADYNRISKIDTNFASIVKTLEKNNLINKDCG
jgi:hypothetical protein